MIQSLRPAISFKSNTLTSARDAYDEHMKNIDATAQKETELAKNLVQDAKEVEKTAQAEVKEVKQEEENQAQASQIQEATLKEGEGQKLDVKA